MTVSLARLERMLAEATERPWSEQALYQGLRHLDRNEDWWWDYAPVEQGGSGELRDPDEPLSYVPVRTDSALIAEAVNALPALIAAVKTLQFHGHAESTDTVISLPVPGCPLCEALAAFSFEAEA